MTFTSAKGTFPWFWCQPLRATCDGFFWCCSIAMMTACGKPVDVIRAVHADVVASGWLPAGVVAGQNKIVPSISVTLKNVSGETLNALQVNAVFRRASEKEEIGSDFRPVAGSQRPAGRCAD